MKTVDTILYSHAVTDHTRLFTFISSWSDVCVVVSIVGCFPFDLLCFKKYLRTRICVKLFSTQMFSWVHFVWSYPASYDMTQFVITQGKSPHDEVKDDTRSFDLVRAIRARRLAWLGHILRTSPARILTQTVEHMCNNRSEVDILTDTPETQSWDELRVWSQNRKKWRIRVHSVWLGSKTTVSLQVLFVPE